MSGICIVQGCPGRFMPKDKYSLHRISNHKPETIQLWLKKIDLTAPLLKLSPEASICSLHFKDDCFITSLDRKRLIPESIPLTFKVGVLKLLKYDLE